ncbi:hypothetical protein OH799_02635 [Nocardia sp. NBC_00881]|uniref:hypothetical protein n=1 Tax=Nocardia sp. NBC_00881 TaxID=2975995 RepID=UPI00386AE9BE|nr:hypothetical protein OH799_02635 [Nocardia sp. NBC_00881]
MISKLAHTFARDDSAGDSKGEVLVPGQVVGTVPEHQIAEVFLEQARRSIQHCEEPEPGGVL